MGNLKPFSHILQELRDRKKWERDSEKKFNEATCSCCKKKLVSQGRSNLVGICVQCVNSSINPED